MQCNFLSLIKACTAACISLISLTSEGIVWVDFVSLFYLCCFLCPAPFLRERFVFVEIVVVVVALQIRWLYIVDAWVKLILFHLF